MAKRRQSNEDYTHKTEKHVARIHNLKTSKTYGKGVAMTPAKNQMQRRTALKIVTQRGYYSRTGSTLTSIVTIALLWDINCLRGRSVV